MSLRLLTEHHLEFLSLKGGYTGSSESTRVKMSHCWNPHVMAQLSFVIRLRTTLVMRHLDMVISLKMVEKNILCLMETWELTHVAEVF